MSVASDQQQYAPTSNLVTPMLTDMYQLTMAYGYWKSGCHNEEAVFDLFFRENPFGGRYTVFAGLDECLRFVSSFKFTEQDIAYLKQIFPPVEDEFYAYLQSLAGGMLHVLAMRQGEVVFPREPLLRISGPLALCQLVETTLLNLVNYPSLIATNASRMRRVAGPSASLLEFGLRRAQGPDGGVSGAKYAILGGFDATSNVLAGQLNGWGGSMIRGTQAHAFIMAYSSLADLTSKSIHTPAGGTYEDFVGLVLQKRVALKATGSNEGELAAFIAYAQAFPNLCLCLVDTYSTLKSGVPNFLAVALALHELKWTPRGIRLDSGDLAQLSKDARQLFREADKTMGTALAEQLNIVASDDIDEDKLKRMKAAGHEVNTYGIGTHLITCKKQPALGCVYKLVKIKADSRIKLSENVQKVTLPNAKRIYRLLVGGRPAKDVALLETEAPPVAGSAYAFFQVEEGQNAYAKTVVTPDRVLPLLFEAWHGARGLGGGEIPSVLSSKELCAEQLGLFFGDTQPDEDRAYTLGVSPALHELTVSLKASMTVK